MGSSKKESYILQALSYSGHVRYVATLDSCGSELPQNDIDWEIEFYETQRTCNFLDTIQGYQVKRVSDGQITRVK